jgi:hypothetical protein
VKDLATYVGTAAIVNKGLATGNWMAAVVLAPERVELER